MPRRDDAKVCSNNLQKWVLSVDSFPNMYSLEFQLCLPILQVTERVNLEL